MRCSIRGDVYIRFTDNVVLWYLPGEDYMCFVNIANPITHSNKLTEY